MSRTSVQPEQQRARDGWGQLRQRLPVFAKFTIGIVVVATIAIVALDWRTRAAISDQFAISERALSREIATLIEAEYRKDPTANLDPFLANVRAAVPEVLLVRIYGLVNGVPTIIASSRTGEAGTRQPGSTDISPINTGVGSQEEDYSALFGERVLETVEPVQVDGDRATVEVYTSLATREAAVAALDNEVRVVVIVAALIQGALIALLLSAPLLRRAQRDRSRLEDTQVRFRRLVESVPVISYIRAVGNAAAPSYVSPQVENSLGFPPNAWIDDPSLWFTRMHPDDVAKTSAALNRHQQTGEPLDATYRMIAKDGSVHWLHDTAVLVRDEHGGSTYTQGIAADVTESMRLSDELRNAKDMAESANLAKSQFLSRMSHELRTPLNAVLGFAQLMQLSDLDDNGTESIGHIRKAGDHLLTLIDEVLEISRIEAGELSVSVEPVVVAPLVGEVCDLLASQAAAAGITLQVDTSVEGVVVAADAQRLKQILFNLIGNAIKYNRAGGSVTLRVNHRGERAVLSITDTGIGIAPDALERVFTAFDRLGAEATTVEGTGLGLALSRALAEAMGGMITVDSQPDVGSTFSLTLPRAHEPSIDLADTPTAPAPSLWSVPLTGRVLYVEDNASNLRLIEQLMARFPGVELITATDGAAGVRLARARTPDVVLLDLNLPDIDGEEVLTQLRGHDATRAVPAVVLSADATPRQIARLEAVGAHTYLTKPVDMTALITVLTDLLPAPTSTMDDESVER